VGGLGEERMDFFAGFLAGAILGSAGSYYYCKRKMGEAIVMLSTAVEERMTAMKKELDEALDTNNHPSEIELETETIQ